MEKTNVIVRHAFYWGAGPTLAEATKHYQKASRKRFNKDVDVYVFSGEDADNIQITESGDLLVPKGVVTIKIQ